MNNTDFVWIRLYMRADEAKRKASKHHWIQIYQEALQTGNETLLQLAEHRLAYMTLMEYEEAE